jgi:hypothetical protein
VRGYLLWGDAVSREPSFFTKRIRIREWKQQRDTTARTDRMASSLEAHRWPTARPSIWRALAITPAELRQSSPNSDPEANPHRDPKSEIAGEYADQRPNGDAEADTRANKPVSAHGRTRDFANGAIIGAPSVARMERGAIRDRRSRIAP